MNLELMPFAESHARAAEARRAPDSSGVLAAIFDERIDSDASKANLESRWSTNNGWKGEFPYARRKVLSLSDVAWMTACLRPESGQSATTASRYSRNLISDSMEWMGRIAASLACQVARFVTSLGPSTPRRMHQSPGRTKALFRTIGTTVLNISVDLRDMLSESESQNCIWRSRSRMLGAWRHSAGVRAYRSKKSRNVPNYGLPR